MKQGRKNGKSNRLTDPEDELLVTGGEMRGRGCSGVWDGHAHTAM